MLIDELWNIVKKDVTYYDLLCNMQDWKIDGVYDGETLAFIVISKGPEFHFVSCGTGLKVNRVILKTWPGSLIEQYGYAETFTPKTPEYARQHRFNKRLGFQPVREDENNVYYRIERLTCL